MEKNSIFVATIAYDFDGQVSSDGGAFTTSDKAMDWLKRKGQEFITDQLENDDDRVENIEDNKVYIAGRCNLYTFNGGIFESRLDDPEGVIMEKMLANREILNEC